MKRIPLTQGKAALVDDEDYERLARHKWYVKHLGDKYYAARNSNGSTILMHRELLGLGKGEIGDHANGDTLDNTRANLRRATFTTNAQNRRRRSDNATAYKGVMHQWKSYGATIDVKGKTIYKGGFATAREAALEYDRLARQHFGEFARTNFEELT